LLRRVVQRSWLFLFFFSHHCSHFERHGYFTMTCSPTPKKALHDQDLRSTETRSISLDLPSVWWLYQDSVFWNGWAKVQLRGIHCTDARMVRIPSGDFFPSSFLQIKKCPRLVV
jgi:hypothetical protein